MTKKTKVEAILKTDSKLRELRKKRDLKQELLADEIGTSQQTVSRIENDKLSMSVETLIRLSAYFNVTTDYLLGISDIEPSEEEDDSRAQELAQLYMALRDRDRELLFSQARKMYELDHKKKEK